MLAARPGCFLVLLEAARAYVLDAGNRLGFVPGSPGDGMGADLLCPNAGCSKYTSGLHPVNIWALAANAVFILLHFAQTHLWYDGLAQDVSIWSSQISVIILLVWILLMENSRRGLFLGKTMPISKQIISFARKYHGYYFAWATIYTFWYHPMESTPAHLVGFLYMFLLLLQGSLFLTRIHINRYWMLALEFSVLIHGTLVAVYQGNGIWPMFFFGFAGMFLITQMHGLGLPTGQNGDSLPLCGRSILIYSQRGWNKLYELISIPLIEYLSVFVLALIIALILRLVNWTVERRRYRRHKYPPPLRRNSEEEVLFYDPHVQQRVRNVSPVQILPIPRSRVGNPALAPRKCLVAVSF